MTSRAQKAAQRLICGLAMLWLSVIALPSVAEENPTSQRFDEFEIYHSIFNTSFLDPKIAQSYDIIRSKQLGLVNVAVRKFREDGSSTAVPALVKVSVSDLMKSTAIEMREIRETDAAIYYIGSFRIDNKQKQFFRFEVRPDPNRPAYKFEIDKVLYTD